MSNIDNILGNLDKVKSLGDGKYKALCPAHNEKTPSLSIRLLDDDRIIIHCFGCGANGIEVIQALGLQPCDLFPEADNEHYKRERTPFPAAQILSCLEFEASVISIAAQMILSKEPLNLHNIERIEKANMLINQAKNYAK